MSETDEAVGRLRAIAAGEDDAGYGFDPLSQVIVNVTDLRTLLAALARVTEERDAANAHIALLEGEGHTGCNERIFQAEQEVEALTRDIATLRERLAGEVGALRIKGVPEPHMESWSYGHDAAIDRAVAVIRGEHG